MTPTPTQTSTPTPTAETGVLYVYAKFRNAENVLQYQINYGTADVIGNIDSLSCSYVYTITGLSVGDTVYFTTYSNGILALDTPPADCPNSGFACDQTYIWTNNDYVYITVDGSVFC
jgi:glucose dehydrogenase